MDCEKFMGEKLGTGMYESQDINDTNYAFSIQDGYIYLEYGKNVCGMAKSPLYAEV